jgi:hypothetical protein
VEAANGGLGDVGGGGRRWASGQGWRQVRGVGRDGAGRLSSAGPMGGRHQAGAADPVEELAHQPAALLLSEVARTPACPELESVASRLDSATTRSDSVVVVLIWLMRTSNPCLSC